MRILAYLLLCVGLAGCANCVTTARNAAVLLSMDDGTCSGTKIGPHAILTAEHCLSGTQHLSVDNVPVEVLGVTLDGHDHAIVRVTATFGQWARVDPYVYQGQEIFNLGNPGELRDMFRHGWVAGEQVIDGKLIYLLDFNGFFGDSGSAIFDDQGEVIAVTSELYRQTAPGGWMKIMAAFPLAFSSKQLESAAR